MSEHPIVARVSSFGAIVALIVIMVAIMLGFIGQLPAWNPLVIGRTWDEGM